MCLIPLCFSTLPPLASHQYHDQFISNVLNNTEFPERIAEYINKTLAQNGFSIEDDGEERNQAMLAPKQVTPASGPSTCSQAPTCNSQAFGSGIEPSVQAANGANPSKVSAVAETVSKMIMDNPSYQNILFDEFGELQLFFLSLVV